MTLDDGALDGPEKGKRRRLDPKRDLCAHEYPDGSRCPMPGTLAVGTVGAQSRNWRPAWYCRYHQPGDHVKLGQDWGEERRILAEEAASLERRRAIDVELERRASHPKLQRQIGEGSSAYAERMLAMCNRLARGAVKPMPGKDQPREPPSPAEDEDVA